MKRQLYYITAIHQMNQPAAKYHGAFDGICHHSEKRRERQAGHMGRASEGICVFTPTVSKFHMQLFHFTCCEIFSVLKVLSSYLLSRPDLSRRCLESTELLCCDENGFCTPQSD